MSETATRSGDKKHGATTMSVWYITLKDLLLLAHDKKALVLLLVLPLILISIIGMSTGQFLTRDENAEKVKLVVIDQDHSPMSRGLVSDLKQRPEFSVTTSSEKATALAELRRGNVIQVLTIGDDFDNRVDAVRMHDVFDMMNEKDTQKGLTGLDLELITRPNSGIAGNLLEAAVYALTLKFITPIAAQTNAVARNWVRTPDEEPSNSAQAQSETDPAPPKQRVSFAVQWVVPGFTVMFAYFLINIMARSFLIEREQGTLRRLKMAPVSVIPLLLGKTIPFYLTSVVQCLLLFLCGRILFGMPWGSQPEYLIPVILSTSSTATALGLLLSTIVRTDQQISSYGTSLILVLSALSGAFLPRELFPKAMKSISLVTPHAWSLRAFDEVLNQSHINPQIVLSCCGILLVFAAAFFTVGWWRFRAVSQS